MYVYKYVRVYDIYVCVYIAYCMYVCVCQYCLPVRGYIHTYLYVGEEYGHYVCVYDIYVCVYIVYCMYVYVCMCMCVYILPVCWRRVRT
jgi:hypothetical protein